MTWVDTHMPYSADGFGETGFRYAVMTEDDRARRRGHVHGFSILPQDCGESDDRGRNYKDLEVPPDRHHAGARPEGSGSVGPSVTPARWSSILFLTSFLALSTI